MAIADDFTIDYVNQRIYHSSGSTVYTLNQLYTYFTLTFDDDVQMDDLPPMSAQTPTAFTMENGWFMDEISLRYLNGGSLTTLGWSASTYDNGIRLLTFGVTYTDAIATDIGKPIVGGTTSSTGTLLYYDNTLKKWWVRTNTTADTFNQAESITITGGTGTGTTTGASVTGENTWANIFTLGTLADNSQIYLYQDSAEITPWWTLNPTDAMDGLGHIDVLVLVKEAGTLIDYGYVTVFARQYSTLYDHYTADLSTGARTPIPLATFTDSNNETGYRTFTGASGVGTFVEGEIIYDATFAMEGIVTAVAGTEAAPEITYYLFKYPLTDFVDTTAITGYTSGATCTVSGSPSDYGPAALAGITITFGATSEDLTNGHGAQPYDCIIDCNDTPLSEIYEYLKYVTRYGETSTLNGTTGESYIGVGEIRLPYTAQSGNFTEGLTVTSAGGATGVIVADHDSGTTGTLILRDVTGTFVATESITDTSTGAATAGTPETISPTKQSPFGTFAGGKFFGARGVWLTNVPAADANNYQLIDSTNTTQIPPMSITLTVNGIIADDQVAVFRATDNNNIVDKSMYTIYDAHSSNSGTIRITSGNAPNDIPNDTPEAGFIRVVQRDASGIITAEQKYQYSGWTNQALYGEFTLTGGNTTQAYDTTDTIYVPYIDETSTGTSVDVALIYTASRYITARVRKSGILPFMIKSQITAANLTITAVRATDSIA